MKNLNKKLEKISKTMHKKTGYSLKHSILEVYEDKEMCILYTHEFFIFNSDEWQIFIELLEEACK